VRRPGRSPAWILGVVYAVVGLNVRTHHRYSTLMILCVGVASNFSIAGHRGHVTPSVGVFGSPVRANAPRLCIIASDSSSRPGRLAVENSTFAKRDGPKLPNKNARSNACAAP